jgi:glycosyltransferase involved in cell wall biosynthesis
MTLSIIIPNRNDPHLERTVSDIQGKARTNPEIIVSDDRHGKLGMRGAINQGVQKSQGTYIMKTDAHCTFDEGFDEKLLATIEDDWVVTPQRYKLDVTTWTVMDEPAVVYERLAIDNPDKIGGVEWRSRKRGREHLTIDENMVFQGSCWLMSRKHWDWLGGLSEEGYGTFTQEPVEIALKTWLGGGKVMVNKNTWYAHKHRKFGRTYSSFTNGEIQRGNAYSRDYWLNNRWAERKHDLCWLMERFGLPCEA